MGFLSMVVLVTFLLLVTVSSFSIRGVQSYRQLRLTTMMSNRLPLVAGNWKMNTDLKSATALAAEIVELTKDADPAKVEVVVCPPFPFLTAVGETISGTVVKLGAQSSYTEVKGAFTGAVSAPMLTSCGCSHIIVGHSERRQMFSVDDYAINKAVLLVQEYGATPILCIGESKEEYELGLNEEICTLQLCKDLRGLTPENVSKLIIAYEPVWAIGTGLSATPEIAQSVHLAIRKWLKRIYGDEVAEKVRILYGGSVTPDTIDSLMKCPDIDGALVGGASLTAKSFARIVNYNP